MRIVFLSRPRIQFPFSYSYCEPTIMKPRLAALVLASFAIVHNAVSVYAAQPGRTLDQLMGIAYTQNCTPGGCKGFPDMDADVVARLMVEHGDPARDTGATPAFNRTATQDRPLLRITKFCRNAQDAFAYVVWQNGEWCRWDAIGCGSRSSQYGQLRADELTRLRAELSNLPASSQAPPIEQTVVLSRNYNGKWIRETYDRTDPPKEVDAIMKLIRGKEGVRPK